MKVRVLLVQPKKMINTPAIKVLVLDEYLTDFKKSGQTEGYLLAADCRPNSVIKFTVYLESGAVWSGLPIEAIFCDRFQEINQKEFKKTEELQPFSCLEGPVSLLSYSLLKHANLKTRLGPANYLFTINYEGEGLSEDPEQHKTHNIVVLGSGQLAALPNNFISVSDNWLADARHDLSQYKRTRKFFFPGG